MAVSSTSYEVRPIGGLVLDPGRLLQRAIEIWHYRGLIRNLVSRNLKTRYKGSVLGFLWSFMNPVLMTIVFTVVFSILQANATVPNYPLFIIIGVLAWNLHQASVMGSIFSIPESAPLITKVYFPREVLPIATVLAAAVNFLIGQIVVMAVAIVLQVPLTFAILAFPAVLAVQMIFSIGLGMLLGAVNVRFRDTAQVVDTLMLAWFFLTPVFYQYADLVPDYARLLFILNPVASFITAYREVLLFGQIPDALFMLRALVQALAFFVIGFIVFYSRSGSFVEDL